MITKHGKAVAKLVPARPRRPASERVEVIREILAFGKTVKATPYTGRVATRRGLPLATHDASLALTGGASMGSFAELAAGTVTVNGGNVTLAGGGGVRHIPNLNLCRRARCHDGCLQSANAAAAAGTAAAR